MKRIFLFLISFQSVCFFNILNSANSFEIKNIPIKNLASTVIKQENEGKKLSNFYFYNTQSGILVNTTFKNDNGVEQREFFNLSSARYQKIFNEMVEMKFRPENVAVYTDGMEIYYAAIFLKKRGNSRRAVHNVDLKTYQQIQRDFNNDGFWFINGNFVKFKNQKIFIAIFEKNSSLKPKLLYQQVANKVKGGKPIGGPAKHGSLGEGPIQVCRYFRFDNVGGYHKVSLASHLGTKTRWIDFENFYPAINPFNVWLCDVKKNGIYNEKLTLDGRYLSEINYTIGNPIH